MSSSLDPLGRSPLLARLRRSALANDLPHSLLLVGPEGSGKEWAALRLACLILAGEDPGGAAGRKARALRHPDLKYIFPAERSLSNDELRALLDLKAHEPLQRVPQPGSAIIPIGDAEDPAPVSARSVRRFINAKPFESRCRVVVIGDAHRMNRPAANALLKTLEEPPTTALLMLCTHQPHLLPRTVRSRCALVNVPGLSEEELSAHLRERHGLDEMEAVRIAAVSGGNARRALDLLDPNARRLAAWTSELLAALLEGRRTELAVAAERLGKGQLPSGGHGRKASADPGLSTARDLGMRALDFLTSDLLVLARLESGSTVAAEHVERLQALRGLPAQRLTRIAMQLVAARTDLARNVNVGLVLTQVLLSAADQARREAAQGG